MRLEFFVQLNDTTTELERLQEKVTQDRCVVRNYVHIYILCLCPHVLLLLFDGTFCVHFMFNIIIDIHVTVTWSLLSW